MWEQHSIMTQEILKDQVAIVTGGTKGIGKGIVFSFIQHGATVYICGQNSEVGKEVAKEANELAKDIAKDGRAFFLQADVSNREEVDKIIQEALTNHKKIDILVNNAGITRDSLLLKMTDEDWDRVIEVNLKSCFHTCQAAMRPMLKARKGKIINISSVVGLIGNPGQANYAASKAGIIGFSKSLAREIASRNICVNCIAPGYIETNMTEAIPESIRNELTSKIPLGRMGKVEDIAACALFLASPSSDYITGQVLTCDGGLAM